MQVVYFNNLQDDIVYHSNIFNYDKQFLSKLIKTRIKLNFTEYAQEKNLKQEELELITKFLKSKAKDQVELLTTALDHEYNRLPQDDEETQKKYKIPKLPQKL